MRILICDDDPLFVQQLEHLLCLYFKKCKIPCPEICCFSNGETLLADQGAHDLLFLDIEMPGTNGIFIGNKLMKEYPNLIIIVITSFSEYLDSAMRFHVFRYLSKPLDKQRLFQNLHDALTLYHSFEKPIIVETKDRIYNINSSDIVSIESYDRNTLIHTLFRDYSAIKKIQFWADCLPKNTFFKTHRSFIVNFKYVCDFDHSMVYLADHKFQAYLTKRNYTACDILPHL
ncbi:MAG: LytR/AlgR family response regulator transcription factor [Lachnospiraceae bacterium]